MSQPLLLELSDEVYAALRRQAETDCLSPAELAATLLARQFSVGKGLTSTGKPLTEAEKQSARQRFERHFGAVNLGHASGADNEGIDTDLAREYADKHEGG